MAREYRYREPGVEPTPDEVTAVHPVAPGPVVQRAAFTERTVRVERPDYSEQRRVVVEPTYVEPAYAPAYVEPGYVPAYVEPREYLTLGHQVNRVIWYLFGLLEGLLALRFVLKAVGANPENGFAAFIYRVTGLFVAPFRGLVPTPSADGAALETTTLIAMFVYLLVAIAVTKLVQILTTRTISD